MQPQGLAQFGNIPQDSVISATYTHAHGISPGVCSLTVKLGTPIGRGGNLSFTFGIQGVVFRNCRADLANLELTGDGHHWQVQILDRRWKWRFGEVNGFYNRRDDRNRVISRSEKSPKLLAAILFAAMGEGNFDVSALPDETRPLMEWVGANPAEELARLCDELGCRIVLQLDDRVKIHRIGIGNQLAGIVPGVTMSSGRGIDPPEKPDTIKVIGGPTLFQADLSLEPVGLELDGSIIPVDDLSYKPSGGWSTNRSHLFPELNANPEAQDLARRTVFRWYRPKVSNANPLDIEVVNLQITDLEQLLPLFSEQVETYTDAATGRKRHKPAIVFGQYFRNGFGTKNSRPAERWKGGFKILKEIGVVEFPVQARRHKIVSLNSPSELEPAILTLRTSFFARKNLTTGEYHRISFTLQTQPPLSGTGPEIVDKQDEIQLHVWQFQPRGNIWKTNLQDDDLDTKLQHYANAALIKYQVTDSGEDNYAGIVPIDLDGAIQQVTYSVGPDGAETLVGRNREVNPFYPTYAQRRRAEKEKESAKEAAAGKKESIRTRHEQKGVRV